MDFSDEYFSDNQMAHVLNMSVGGLRNKIYRNQPGALPDSTQLLRDRIWEKSKVRAWLLKSLTPGAVDELMKRGEAAPAKPLPSATTKRDKAVPAAG